MFTNEKAVTLKPSKDFPPYNLVYHYSQTWKDEGVFKDLGNLTYYGQRTEKKGFRGGILFCRK